MTMKSSMMPPALPGDLSTVINGEAESSWAEALAGLAHDALPGQVRQVAHVSIVDTLACVVAGRRQATAGMLAATFGGSSSGAARYGLEATWSGLEASADPARHALMLGVLAHVNDLDDVCWTMMGHPSAPVVAAALAALDLAPQTVDGPTLVTAVTAGLEATIDLGSRVVPTIYERGWHATSVAGVVGAGVAAARVLGLDGDAMRNTMGTAASSAAGLRVNFGSDVKSLHVGRAAALGLEAAMLARQGAVADRSWLTGRFGYLDVMLGSSWRDTNAATEVRQDRDSWLMVNPGILLKRHASCAATHPAVDAVIALRDQLPGADGRFEGAERSARGDAIERIEVVTAHTAALPLLDRMPTSALEAKFSMEFCVARGMLDGSLGLDAFTDVVFGDADIASLARRVEFTAEPPSPAAIPATDNRASAATVTVYLRDGHREHLRVEYPAGAPEHPLTAEQFAAKVAACWRYGTEDPQAPSSSDTADEAADRIGFVTSAPDVATALADLAPPRSRYAQRRPS